jgi:hypothetical protein
VEAVETFTLGFTVLNGGGNAVHGDGISNFTFTINDNDPGPIVPGTPADYTVGAVQALATTQGALRSDKQRHRMQVLFSAAELTASGIVAGNMTGLTLYVNTKNSTQAFQGLTISLGLTAAANLNGGFIAPAFTQVYNATFNSVAGNNNFVFGTGGGSSSTFVWNGTSNVVVQICFDNGVAVPDPAADQMLVSVNPLGAGVGVTTYANYLSGGTAGCALGAAFVSTARVVATFTMALAGNPVITSLTSKTEYLGPNSDVYFFSNTGETMARVVNLSSHDYGCTQVVVDRIGSTSVPFWNNNPANYLMNKTFRVLPTTNNASGNYQITLYYSQAEVNGWQTATGQSFASSQLIKVANQISDVTPGNPSGGGTVNVVAASHGTFGTSSTITATFSNGFSGFGVGLAGFALPVKLIDFTGRLEKNSVVLNWKTTFEQNSKGFDIERSYDGNNFTSIGFVPSAGNSNITRTYSFKDQDVAQQINYYRLRQLDLDNQFEYSKVVTIKNANNLASPFVVMNNPFNTSIDLQFAKAPEGNVQIKLFDIAGRAIIKWDRKNVSYNRLRLDVGDRHLSQGTYILHVIVKDKEYVEKVIKQ